MAQLLNVELLTNQSLSTLKWDPETNRQTGEPHRAADVYVFCLLAHKDQATLDPLNLDQWEFYVLPTVILNERKRSQHSITLPSLKKLNAGPYDYTRLRDVVLRSAEGRESYSS